MCSGGYKRPPSIKHNAQTTLKGPTQVKNKAAYKIRFITESRETQKKNADLIDDVRASKHI